MIGEKQKQLIQKNWSYLQPKSLQIVERFYYELFKKFPGFQELFTGNAYRQSVKFSDMLGMMIQGLDNPSELETVLKESGNRHVEYGVKPAYYAPVGQILIESIQEASGDYWNQDIEDAWNALLEQVVSAMTA